MVSPPSQPTAGMANSARPKRPHFKYGLLGKTCCPSGWGIISSHSNLFGVLIKYLILLHHFTVAAGKEVFSHHAHSTPVTKTHYSSMQPGGEHKVCFCSSGRTMARSCREHKPATTAVVWEAFQSLYVTAGCLAVLLPVESTFVGFTYDSQE